MRPGVKAFVNTLGTTFVRVVGYWELWLLMSVCIVVTGFMSARGYSWTAIFFFQLGALVCAASAHIGIAQQYLGAFRPQPTLPVSPRTRAVAESLAIGAIMSSILVVVAIGRSFKIFAGLQLDTWDIQVLALSLFVAWPAVLFALFQNKKSPAASLFTPLGIMMGQWVIAGKSPIATLGVGLCSTLLILFVGPRLQLNVDLDILPSFNHGKRCRKGLPPLARLKHDLWHGVWRGALRGTLVTILVTLLLFLIGNALAENGTVPWQIALSFGSLVGGLVALSSPLGAYVNISVSNGGFRLYAFGDAYAHIPVARHHVARAVTIHCAQALGAAQALAIAGILIITWPRTIEEAAGLYAYLLNITASSFLVGWCATILIGRKGSFKRLFLGLPFYYLVIFTVPAWMMGNPTDDQMWVFTWMAGVLIPLFVASLLALWPIWPSLVPQAPIHPHHTRQMHFEEEHND
ncbi:MAG: hypothetical protein HN348_25790 [Proteobacteria bacterium]|jgi:hypothetical protein|nr:hypothetical protein [Pseudomonadota bacterium]